MAGARGRGEWGGESGRKGPRDNGGRSAVEGEMNGDEEGQPRREFKTVTRKKDASRKTAEQARGG